MTTPLDRLCADFPGVPRPIVIKTDLLTRGIRFTPLAHEIGRWAIPEFLPWDREVHKDYQAIESDLVDRDWAWLPHSMRFPEGVVTKVLYDFMRHGTSPYELRPANGAFELTCDGVPVTTVAFDRRPRWLSAPLADGRQMSSVFVLSSVDRLLGFPIRYCAHYQPEDVCRFCCLNPAGKNIARGDGYHDVVMVEDTAAQCFAAALDETDVRHLTLTGGALRDQNKEAQIFARVVERLARVRDARRPDLTIQVVSTALDAGGQRRLKDAGTDEVSFNMEVWGERLWPEIVPGKSRHHGRATWMERLEQAVACFGRGRVYCQFVVGIEMASGAFATHADAIASVLEGVTWCAERGIQPSTHVWCNTPGSAYETRSGPPAAYFLTVAAERHRILERHDMNFPRDAARSYSSTCRPCSYLSADADFQWLGAAG